MIVVDTSDIMDMERNLQAFARRAFPHATKKTINESAFQAQRIARADVRNSMITRNRFTEQSIRVEQAKTLNVNEQYSVVGSIADYMETQEFGGVKRKGGKEGVALATTYASGEGMDANVRKRLPRRTNKLSAISLRKGRKKGRTKKQQNFIAIREAAASGRKFVFLDLGRSKGIFRVVGGVSRPKIRMTHDMSRQSVTIPRNPWLKPAVDETTRMMPAFYADALRFQVNRLNLFN